jgi:hypothetical protein
MLKNLKEFVDIFCLKWFIFKSFFWLKWDLDQGPEQRESKPTVLCPLIIIILISCIIIYYIIIIKSLILENHPSRNRKRNSIYFCCRVLGETIDT